ncbi:DUF2125 domain-containing protein [Marivita sp. S0852]|uniref:DUF2125 domain-containing protein n=1 Tax=Marivita sp. S0852 TaxID=3373893 RepID=UPI0039826F6C
MKRLLSVIVVAALGYSGWWVYAAQSLETSVERWFTEQQQAGWQASYTDIAVRGFPNRTDLTITNPSLTSPDGRYAWSAPFFQILGLSYKKGHQIVAWPDTQTLTTPNGDNFISSDGLRASIVHQESILIRTNIEAATLNVDGPDQAVAFAGVNAALEKVEPADASYRIAISVDGIAVSNPRVSGEMAPDALASLRSDIRLDLTKPLTLDGPSSDSPQPTYFATSRSAINYGAVTFKVNADADIDARGRASGEVSLEADNWRDALNAARDSGDLPPALTEAVIELLSMLSGFGGARDALDITLGLTDGTVFLGPLPIGELPAIRIP